MGHAEDAVIVGGGPSGAYCAFELARHGINATIFDHSHPREKPCGGGISPQVIQKFPFVERFRSRCGVSADFKMISCTDKQVAVVKQRQGFNLSRRFFDEQILDLAISNGAKLVNEEVVDVCKRENLWQVKTEKQLVTTKILIGADGVNSLVRRKTVGAIRRENLGLAYGYFATGVENEPTTVKFVGEIPGYIWIFPRDSHSSIGIGGESKHGSTLKRILDKFIHSYCPQIKITSKFVATLPWVTDPDFYQLPCAGENWILIGDAAGHTDPLTGEGILYALWSGKLAAEATAKGEPHLYDELWREEYGNNLRQRCNQRNTFYDPLAIEFSIATHSQRLPWIT